eukprot:TRINITY_DN59885_c0_g1_i1.p1 TRINITY_DN59885_c0_g1~~TRINITY_DN59885_c0_g1_i1.p1  ORF type:complete len:581 (+),score=167.93 TRINITY_DN59885_c0_g1_i1:96-1745(+)
MASPVDEFITQWGLSYEAGQALQSLGQQRAMNIIAEISPMMEACRDPNGLVTAFTEREIQASQTPDLGDPVSNFVAINLLDHNVDTSLRKLQAEQPEECQKIIDELGKIQGARNNNAVVMKRVRAALGVSLTPAGPAAAAAVPEISEEQQAHMQQIIDEFVAQNNLDDSIGGVMLSLGLERAARIAQELGVIQGARNNNAIVMSRIKQERQGVGGLAPRCPLAIARRAGGPTGEEATKRFNEWVARYGLDSRTEEEMLALDEGTRMAMIDSLWNLESARNPNAIVMTEIRKLRQYGNQQIGTGLPVSDQVAHFIMQNSLDDGAQQALMSLDPQTQQHIVQNLGVIENVRNPSAVVTCEIRRLVQSGIPVGSFRPGGAMRYSPYPMGGMGMMMPGQRMLGMRPEAAMRPVHTGGDMIQNFCITNGLEPSLETTLRSLPENECAQIISELNIITNARNPNAVVMARINRGRHHAAEAAERMLSREPRQMATGGDAIRNFCVTNNLEPGIETTLRGLPEDECNQILQELAIITNARNPNAIVMARINRGKRH